MLKSRLEKPPLTNKRVIERPRLMRLLKENTDKQVILVCAPAGFGKSVAISQWSEQLDTPTAWVSLGPGQDSLDLILTYLVESIRKKYPNQLKKSLARSRNRLGRSVLEIAEVLSNEIGALPKPLLLVLDDYHSITNPEIHLLLQSLLEHPPKTLSLVLITRNTPAIRFSRLRLYDRVLEIKKHHLAFTRLEIEQLLNHANLSENSKELFQNLQRAEGWILGIKLMLSNYLLNPNQQFSAEKGSDQEYLIGQLCAGLSSEMFEALCMCALLESFRADLLDVLFKESGSIQITGEDFIQEIRNLNLFLTKDENHEGWFRFHHLFRQLVRDQCRDSESARKAKLLTLVSKWLASKGFVDQAIDYAVAAHDFDLAVRHIERHRMKAFDDDRWWQVASWIQKIPIDTIKGNAMLLLSLMWINEYTWKLGEIPKLLIRFENLGKKKLSDRDQAEYYLHLGHHYLFVQCDPREALRYLEESKNCYPDKGMLGARREMILGINRQMLGHSKTALESLQSLISHNESHSALYLRCMISKAIVHLLSAQLEKAEWVSTTLKSDASKTPFRTIKSWSLYLSGIIAFQYASDTAREHFRDALEFEDAMNNRVFVDTLAGIALSFALEVRHTDALHALRELRENAYQIKDASLKIVAESTEKRIQLILGIRDNSLHMPIPISDTQIMQFYFLNEVPALTKSRILICAGSPVEVRKGLDTIQYLCKILSSIYNSFHLLDLYLLAAVGYKRCGEEDTAMDYVKKASQEYSKNQQIRPYMEIQRTVPDFFKWVPEKYLPAAFDIEPLPPGVTEPIPTPYDQLLMASLTKREIQVVQLVVRGQRNKEVAKALKISEVTVKTHLSNIFRKLGIDNRTTLARLSTLS